MALPGGFLDHEFVADFAGGVVGAVGKGIPVDLEDLVGGDVGHADSGVGERVLLVHFRS